LAVPLRKDRCPKRRALERGLVAALADAKKPRRVGPGREREASTRTSFMVGASRNFGQGCRTQPMFWSAVRATFRRLRGDLRHLSELIKAGRLRAVL